MRQFFAAALFIFSFILVHPALAEKAKVAGPWPPKVGEVYPNLKLIDQEGQAFNLGDLKGKVILLEPVAMTCPACQAFSGGADLGGFEGAAVQPGLPSIERLLPQYTNGIFLPHSDIVLVQLILFDLDNKHPAPLDAAKWAYHFNFEKSKNFIVAVGPDDLRSKAAFNMIPGFQLIDREFILRADSTGHYPQHDLYKQLLPHVANMVSPERTP